MTKKISGEIIENVDDTKQSDEKLPVAYPITPVHVGERSSDRFANVFPPFSDELLSSWIARLMLANLTDIAEFNSIYGYKPGAIDFDFDVDNPVISAITRMTGIPKAQIETASLINEKLESQKSISNHKGGSSKLLDFCFLSWVVREKDTGIRYCPMCLKSDKVPYFRKSWRLGFLTFCPIHHCLMEDKCPACHSPIFFYRLRDINHLRGCSKCGQDLAAAPAHPLAVPDPLLDISLDFFKILDYLKLYEVLTLSWLMSGICGIADPAFHEHPIAKKDAVIDLWRRHHKKSNRLKLFRNTEYTYLLIGTAIHILQSGDAGFFAKYHTSGNDFWKIRPFVCTVPGCKYRTHKYGDILGHTHNRQDEYACDICFAHFNKREALLHHEQDHDAGTNPCPQCGENFATKADLKDHMELHASKLLICKECGKYFGNKGHLRMHLASHSEERPFACPICGLALKLEGGLTNHLKTHSDVKPFKCDKCGQEFRQKHHLEMHVGIHTGEKPCVCEYCGKSFIQQSALTVHLRLHSKEKPYRCKVCGKDFRHTYSLAAHLRTHSGEKPYVCPVCKKQFRMPHHLKQHQRLHTGEKPYKCPECGKEFARKHHLQSHLMTHTGEKPFKCETCGKMFSLKQNMKIHLKTHLKKENP